jgi:DNA-binding beta-propeller fold protein YncE
VTSPPLKAPKIAEPGWSARRKLLAAAVVLGAIAAAAGTAAVLLSRDDAPAVVPESLVKIDAGTNEIVDVVPVGRSPGEVEIVGDYVFVATVEDGTLFRVDTRTADLTYSGRYSADGSIARQGDAWLWVASERRGEVSQVETDTLTFFTSIPLPERSGSRTYLDRESASIGVGGGSSSVCL